LFGLTVAGAIRYTATVEQPDLVGPSKTGSY
jgi:hypothetical protein